MVLNDDHRPRILLIVDIPNWAFHTLARAIQSGLAHRFRCDIMIGSQLAAFDETDYDLIHVFFEMERNHLPYVHGKTRILKSVYSHYWQQWGMSVADFYKTHLREAHAVCVPSALLADALRELPVPVSIAPEGVDTSFFTPAGIKREGPLVVGWAGHPNRSIKRLEWMKAATDDLCELRLTNGLLSPEEMREFYRSVDIIACSSIAEGAPRPLMEGMSCGLFPLSFDVGIAGELINGNRNGYLVQNNTIEGLRSAVEWCVEHPDKIRDTAFLNRNIAIARRDWRVTLPAQEHIYDTILATR